MEMTLKNGFQELSFDELQAVDGGWTAQEWIVGTSTVVGSLVGGALGTAIGGPIGTAIGGKLGAAVSTVVSVGVGSIVGYAANRYSDWATR